MPQPNVFAHFVGYAFVDDINIIQSSLKNDYLEALAWLQQTIDTWENNLKATYSAIAPDKTVWWLFSFKWQGNHWQYMSIQDAPGELYIIDVNGVWQQLKRLEPSQAYEMLGVFLAPDCNQHVQLDKLKAGTNFCTRLREFLQDNQ